MSECNSGNCHYFNKNELCKSTILNMIKSSNPHMEDNSTLKHLISVEGYKQIVCHLRSLYR